MHLVEALSLERGILEFQIGSLRVHQVHAHLLSDCRWSNMFISRVMLATN